PSRRRQSSWPWSGENCHRMSDSNRRIRRSPSRTSWSSVAPGAQDRRSRIRSASEATTRSWFSLLLNENESGYGGDRRGSPVDRAERESGDSDRLNLIRVIPAKGFLGLSGSSVGSDQGPNT